MVSSCVLCNWKSSYTPRRMLHKFPSNANQKSKWLKLVNKSKWPVGKSSMVCSIHFRRSAYVKMKNGKMFLKPDSVPSLNLNKKTDGTAAQARKDSKPTVKRPMHSCEHCDRNFHTAQALQNHLKTHAKPENSPANEVTEDIKQDKAMPITNATDPTSETDATSAAEPEAVVPATNAPTVGFQCPICRKTFKVYFNASRHIAKNHPVDSNGEKVPSNSPDIVKPIQIEGTGDTSPESPETTDEPPKPSPMCTDKYLCLGCNQEFNNIKLFGVHLKGVHCDEYESYFLPNKSDFTELKTSIEDQLKTKYVILIKPHTDSSTSQMYHCSHQPIDNSDITHLCPSTITVKELPEGCQVTYHRQHASHTPPTVAIPEKFKKHNITNFFNDTDNKDESIEEDDKDDKDLYVRFKKIMSNIVLEAAKINIRSLNSLLGKALQMTTVLNNYDEDDDVHISKQHNITDEQITHALEDVEMQFIRKSTTETSNGTVEENRMNEANGEVRTVRSPPSFNDSYKTFVDETIKKTESVKKYVVKKKEVVKTKIGQFKPSLSPKSDANTKTATPNANLHKYAKRIRPNKPDIRYEVKEQENDCNILILKI